MLKEAFLVFVGGGAGSVLRYGVAVAAFRAVGPAFPWGTLAVNLVGCLAIGLIAGLTATRPSPDLAAFPFLGMSHDARLLLITGVLGGFTTLSALSIETVELLRHGQTGRAVLYVLASVLAGLALAWAGWSLGLRTPFLPPPASPSP